MKEFFLNLQKSIREKGYWYFILFFLLILSMFLFSVAIAIIQKHRKIEREYEKTYTEWQYYSLYDSMLGEIEQEIYQNPVAVMQLKRMNELLHEEENFTYLEVYDNAVYIRDYKGTLENLNGYETNHYEHSDKVEIHGQGMGFYSAVKGMWVGRNVFEHFQLCLSEGTVPEEQDFIWRETDTVKVVLGAAYRDTYQLGERFQLDFYIADKEAEVVGFLAEGAVLAYKNKLVNLDQYLLLPQYDLPYPSQEVESEEYHSFWFAYLMKNNGMVAAHCSAEGVQEIVSSLCEKVGLPLIYYIDQADYRQMTTFGTNMKELTETLFLLALGSMGLSVVLLCVHFVLRIKDNMRYYAILCSCGYSMKKIIGMIVAELAGLLLVSAVVGYFFAMLLTSLLTVGLPPAYLLVFFVVGYGIVPFFITLHCLWKVDLATSLRK